MKIKETERLTGIPAANIRYYEKEGLLKPGRNKENNYREYSEEDVLRLKQIKVLRLLGITLDEIKELYMQEETLETVIEHRLMQIEEEETRLKEVRRTCENILQSRMDLESLDQSILDGDGTFWKERLQKVLAEDMSKTLLDQRQFHFHIGGMLIWGYLLHLGVTLLTRNVFDVSRKKLWIKIFARDFAGSNEMIDAGPGGAEMFFLFTVAFCLMIGCGIAVWWSAKMAIQTVVFHLSALLGAPILMMVTSFFAGEEMQQSICSFLPVFWGLIIGYVLVLLVIQRVWRDFFRKTRYPVAAAIIGSVLITLIGWFMTGQLIMPAVLAVIYTTYISIFWSVADIDAKGDYTRYSAVLAAERIMNPVALTLSYWGKSKTPLWVNWDR